LNPRPPPFLAFIISNLLFEPTHRRASLYPN